MTKWQTLSVRDWMAATPARSGLVSGTVFGACMSVMLGVEQGTAGIAAGVIAGVVFGLLMGVVVKKTGPRWPAHASVRTRERAVRVVRRGEATGDPVIAAAVVALAARVGRTQRGERYFRPLAGLACLLYMAAGAASAAGGQAPLAAWWVLLAVLWGALAWVIPVIRRRQRHNAAVAAGIAREVLDQRPCSQVR